MDPPRTNDRRRIRTDAAVVGAVVLIGGFLVACLIWRGVTIADQDVEGPVVGALIAVAFTFVVAVRRAPLVLAAGVLGSLLLSALLLFLLPNDARVWKFRLAESKADDALHQTLAEEFCGARAVDLPLLGRTDSVCARHYPDGTEVDFTRGAEQGIVWTDRPPDHQYGRCTRHLDGNWYAFVPNQPPGPSADGFTCYGSP